jgi:hypothetical protein
MPLGEPAKKRGSDYVEMIISLSRRVQAFVDLNQNTSEAAFRKADDCDAWPQSCFAQSGGWHERCSFPSWFRKVDLPGATAHGFVQRRLDHAVDNSRDSVGLVADWLAFECWGQSHSPTTRSRRGCFDYQPRDRATSRLTFFQ